MAPFHLLFPEIGSAQTRTVRVSAGRSIPKGEYGFFDRYCVDPDCDCRRVMLSVYSRARDALVATINHAFDEKNAEPDLGQTFLDPLNPQSRRSSGLLDLFTHELLRDEPYMRRLEAHYREVKRALTDPGHVIHARIAKMTAPSRRSRAERAEEARRVSSAARVARAKGKSPRQAPPKREPPRRPVAAQPGGRAASAPVLQIDAPRFGAIDVRERATDWTSFLSALDQAADPADVFLRIDYERLRLQGEFDDLIGAGGPEHRNTGFRSRPRGRFSAFHGPHLLADEVGTSANVEAGLAIKEIHDEGLARRVLIWPLLRWYPSEEGDAFSSISIQTTDGTDFARREEFGRGSHHRLAPYGEDDENADRVASQPFDIVVVDGRITFEIAARAWQLVSRLRSGFSFSKRDAGSEQLINQSDYASRPGNFRRERLPERIHDREQPREQEKLRGLLRDVMIRNTRSAIELR